MDESGTSNSFSSTFLDSAKLKSFKDAVFHQHLDFLCAKSEFSECAPNLILSGLHVTLTLIAFAYWLLSVSLYQKPSCVGLLPLHRIRWILSVLLMTVHLVNLADCLLLISNGRTDSLESLHILLYSATSLMAVVTSLAFYSHCEQKRRWKALVILVVFWPLSIAGQLYKFVSLLNKGVSFQHLCLQCTLASIGMTLILFIIETYVIFNQMAVSKRHSEGIERLQEHEDDWKNVTYRYNVAPLLSQVTFTWVLPLLRKGYETILVQEDLGRTTEEHETETQFQLFDRHLQNEYKKVRKNQGSKANINLWRVYVKTYWKKYLFANILKILGDLLALVGPISIKYILQYIEAERDRSIDHDMLTVFDLFKNGYVVAVAVLICTLLQSTLSNNFMHIVTMQGVYVQSALRGAIYSKTLRLRLRQDNEDQDDEQTDSTSQKETKTDRKIQTTTSVGAIVNHMSTDCQNVMMIFTNLHYVWMLPLKISLTLYLIYDVLGKSALLSSCLLIAVTPIQYLISRAMSRLQTKIMGISDERIKKTRELIQGVKLLKILGWENIFVRKIEQIRSSERKLLKRDTIYVAMNTFLTMLSSVLVPLLSFGLYTWLGGVPLEAGVIFTALSLFNQLTLPLFIVPFAIPIVISSMVSTRRLEEFLSRPEIESNTPWTGQDTDNGKSYPRQYSDDGASILNISEGTLEWNKGVEVLRDLNLNLPSKRLTFIAGPCGAGKTTLLSAILGELELAKGSIEWSDVQARSVAYVPQKPWLENATVKENIVFGKPFNEKKYSDIIEACALKTDFQTLPAGDETEIGERGANLSGGQRQRIAIARAIYSDADLYILDDPLSALDAHVAQAVFEKAIRGSLVQREKTIVMVTQKKDLLAYGHHLIILNEHRVAAKGTHDEVLAKDPSCLDCLDHESDQKPRVEHLKAPRFVKPARKMSATMFTESFERNSDRTYSLTRQMPDIDQSNSYHNGSCVTDRCTMERRGSNVSEWGRVVHCPERSSSPLRKRSHTAGTIKTVIDEPSHTQVNVVEEVDEDQQSFDEKPVWRLVEGEDRCEGTISTKVYLSYAKACGLFAVFLSILFFTIMQLCKMGSDFWLSKWSQYNRNESKKVSEKDALASNWYYLIIYAAISLANVFFAFIANLFAQLTTIRATKPLHDRMLEKVVGCPQSFFDQNPVGRIINRFSTDLNIVDRKLPISFPVLVRFILICLSVVMVNIIVTPLNIVFITISVGVYWYLQHFFRASSRELQRLECLTRSPIISHFSETLNGLHTIRAYRRQEDFVVRLHTFLNSNNIATIMTNSANCWLGVSLDYLGATILFLVVLTNIIAATFGYITPSSVGLTITYTLLIPQYLNWVVKNLTSVEMFMSSVERIENYTTLTTELDQRDLAPIKQITNSSWPSKGKVEFKNLTLKYETSDQPVLNNVNIQITPGQKIGICGRSGSGKSSLVLGLFQMVPLAGGQICIDDVDLAGEDAHEVRSHLSMIPQDPILFEGTVRDNLDPEREFSDEQLYNALERACMKESIDENGGLDSEISEEGSNLSTGEKQLFCLARSILRPSKVLVLDEATSSLDVSLENQMLSIVKDVWKDSTVISIAHRVTSIVDFDYVFVFKGGSIAEQGSPKSLLENSNSEFAALLRSYQSTEKTATTP